MAYEDVLYGQDRAATTDDWEQSPWINNFAVQGALTGLQYLGDTLSKPKNALFGAVGGLLDGDPLEAVKQLGNLIPFSDTMGLTNTKGGLLTEKSTGGYDLLKKTGLVDDQTTGGGAAGFALDLLADPANWLTFGAGAVTKAGRAAELAGKLEPTLLGRIKTGQGGIMGIANKPWYAELLGGAPAENIAVLGMGKGGEAFASGLDKGVSAATRFTIPGTDFAPIGALRAAFSKGSGNTGYGPIVDEFGGGFGKTNVNRIEGEMATASRRNAFPALDYQSEAINELLATGMAEEAIPAALNRAAVTHHELGRMKMAQNLTPQQEQIVSNYAQKFSAHMGPHLQAEKDAYRALGGQLEDTSNIWGHRYLNRAQAEMGNAAGTAMKQRTPFINDLPGGQDMFEQWAINPQFSGIATRKVAGQAYDGVAIQAAVKQNASDMAQEIMAEAQQQLAVMQQQGLKVPQRALDIAANANGAADNLANEAANYIAKLDPKIVDRGMFYRQDLGSNALAYGANMAKQKAVNTGALNVLAKEGKDIDSMLMKATNTNDVVSLKQAIEELQMAGAEQTLMTKIPGMASVDDLASRGVSRKLVDKLKQEVNPGDAAGENFIDKLSSAFRYGVTIPFPANFFRNWTGELANTAVAGQNPVRGLGNTMKFYNQTLDDPLARAAASATEREGLITGVLGTDQVRAMLGTGTHNGERMLNYNPTPSMRTTGEIARDFAKPITSAAKRAEMEITPLKELAGVPTGQPPSSAAGKAVAALGDYVVDPVRGYMAAMETAHAFQNKATRHQALQALMDQGYTAEGAAKRVLTTQRNYENLSDFERKYMRNLVPFWNFTKQNAISQADMIARNPGRYNAMLQTVNSGRADDSFVPSWASSGTAIPIPGAAEGQQRFIGNLGLPVEDEAIGALGALLSGSPGEAVRRAASSSNPILKTIYETATGRQVFSGRDLEDLKPSPVVSALLGDNKFSRGLTQAVTGTPMSRSLSTVDRLVNSPEKGVLSTLLNLGTGIRTVDVDQDQAAGIAARQQIERLMMESGQFKKRENIFLKPELRDQKDQLPPEVQELMQYHQALLKKAQDAAKLKALADSPR